MTLREIGNFLFYVYDQNMTVRELREKIFQLEDQDKELTNYVVICNNEKD